MWLGLADAEQPTLLPEPALVNLAEDSLLVQLVARAFLAGLLMADALEKFRDR
jgi:hypothetical protein